MHHMGMQDIQTMHVLVNNKNRVVLKTKLHACSPKSRVFLFFFGVVGGLEMVGPRPGSFPP